MTSKAPTRLRPLLRPLALLGLVAALHLGAHAASPAEEGVRAAMMKTWDRPEQRLQVDPVVVVGEHALAGWVQGERGGRALLRQGGQGWEVKVCGGDGLKDPAALKDAGLDATAAGALIAGLNEAERKLPPEQVKRFALFGKNVNVGADHGPGAHGTGQGAGHGATHPVPAAHGASAAHGH